MIIDFAHVQATHKLLDDADTEISKLLERIAAQLRTFIGVRLQIALPDGAQLAYGKHNGAWTFLYVTDATEGEWKPLASAPRDVRAFVLVDGWIMTLIRAAANTLATEIAYRERALEAAGVILTALAEAGASRT